MDNDIPKERLEKSKDDRKVILKATEPKLSSEGLIAMAATIGYGVTATEVNLVGAAEEKVIAELNKKIEQAEEAGSYFVTITRKEGEKLFHWMGAVKFPKDDKANSLRELLKMVPSAYHGKKGNVRKFGPRKHGG